MKRKKGERGNKESEMKNDEQRDIKHFSTIAVGSILTLPVSSLGFAK